MRRNAGPRALLLVLAAALSIAATHGDLAVHRWTEADALPQSTATSLVMGDDGYLYVGTFGGLTRFAVVGAFPATTDDASTARYARVTALARHPDGGVWAGLESGGIHHFDGSWAEIAQPVALTRGTVWSVASSPRGLLAAAKSGAWWRRPDGTWTRISDQEQLAVGWTADGHAWYGGVDGLFRVRDPENPDVEPELVVAAETLAVRPGSVPGSLWVAAAGPARYIDPDGQVHPLHPSTAGPRLGSPPVEGPRGRLWLTAGESLLTYERWTDALDPDNAPTSQVALLGEPRALVAPEADAAWVGTFGRGVARVSVTPHTSVLHVQHLGESGPVAASDDGGVWASPACDRVVHLDTEGRATARIDLPDDGISGCIEALAAAPDGAVLVGRGPRVERVRDGEIDLVLTAPGSEPGPVISSISPLDDGTWAVGTTRGALYRMAGDPPTLSPWTAPPLGRVYRVVQRDGRTWVATSSGLWEHDGAAWRPHDASTGFAFGPIRDVHLDERGVAWAVSYGNGIGWTTGAQDGRITPHDGLLDGHLSSLTAVDDTWWVHGNAGLQRLDPHALEARRRGDPARLLPTLYKVGEVEGSPRPSAALTDDGQLWLATTDAIVAFDTHRAIATVAATPRAPRIEEIRLDNRRADPREVVEVPADSQRTIEITLSAPSLDPEARPRFSWRLIRGGEVEDDVAWSEPNEGTRIVLERIPPGKHRLEVRRFHGDQGSAITTAHLHVMPKLHERSWFLPLLVLAALGIAFLLGVARTRAAQRHAAQLEAQVRARRATEQQLAEHEHQYRLLFESTPTATLVVDADHRCLVANPAATALLGGALGGRPVSLVGLTADGADVAPQELALRRLDGATFPARVTRTRLGRRYLYTIVDLTAQRAADADRARLAQAHHAARLSQALARLGGSVAHEINNLAAVMLQQVDLLTEEPVDWSADARQALAELQTGVRRAGRLGFRMLTFGSPQGHHPQPVHVNEVVTELMSLAVEVLPEGCAIQPSLRASRTAYFDPADLGRIVVAMILGAADAASDGIMEVATRDDDDHIQITVRARRRSGSAEAWSPAGTLHEAAARGGGALHDHTGHGEVHLEFRVPAHRPVPDAALELPFDRAPTPGVEIVLVEDREAIRVGLARMLTRRGHVVHAFGSSDDALAWLEDPANRVELLITDVHEIGELDGRALADRLQEANGGLPVLFISGFAPRGVAHPDRAGQERLLLKPFGPDELIQAVDALLAAR